MLIARQIDVRANIKKYFDIAFNGEQVIIPRKENKNVVIISEKEYKALEKARRNEEYITKLNRSDLQIKQGKVVIKTINDLDTTTE